MTIFKNVFQKHLEQRDAEDDITPLGPKPSSAPAVPPASAGPGMPEPTLKLPTSSTHDLPPLVGRARSVPRALPSEMPPVAEMDAEEVAARAAEAHKLIAETSTKRQALDGPQASGPTPATAAPTRSNRNRTRLLGFGSADTAQVDPLSDLEDTPAQATFPCGWLVIVDGPGRGASFAIHPGIALIGRGEDQNIKLDFGDRAISREKHAIVAYDTETAKFYLGHGGKSNIIRLNDRPVLSTEEMAHGDMIRIGETSLRFAAFCDATFTWQEQEV